MRGLFEFDYEGIKRGFYFNFDALAILEEQENIPIDDILAQLSADDKRPKLRLMGKFFYAAALNYCEAKDIEVDFNRHNVSDWISEIGLEQAGKLLMQSLSATTPKNLNPLQSTEGKKLAGELANT